MTFLLIAKHGRDKAHVLMIRIEAHALILGGAFMRGNRVLIWHFKNIFLQQRTQCNANIIIFKKNLRPPYSNWVISKVLRP